MRKLIVVVGVLGILVAVFMFARRNSPMFNFVFTPHDMFEPLAAKVVDLARQGNTITLHFSPKYPGNQCLDLEVDKLDPGSPIKSTLALSVTIKNGNGNQIQTKPASFSNFWSEKYKGFSLVTFRVPEDLKVGESVTVVVTVSSADTQFTEKYGSTHFVVRKGADE